MTKTVPCMVWFSTRVPIKEEGGPSTSMKFELGSVGRN